MLLTRIQAHEPALAVYQSLLKRLPERADFHYYAGYHALHLDRRELAREHFHKTVSAIPEHSLALGFLGYMALQENRSGEAEGFLSRAVEADPQNPFFRLRLGTIYLGKGPLAAHQARLHLQAARAHPATAQQAEETLLSQALAQAS
jgi:tetratricopeptide (TPR) repeat protein